jgi:hypothetical protein
MMPDSEEAPPSIGNLYAINESKEEDSHLISPHLEGDGLNRVCVKW